MPSFENDPLATLRVTKPITVEPQGLNLADEVIAAPCDVSNLLHRSQNLHQQIFAKGISSISEGVDNSFTANVCLSWFPPNADLDKSNCRNSAGVFLQFAIKNGQWHDLIQSLEVERVVYARFPKDEDHAQFQSWVDGLVPALNDPELHQLGMALLKTYHELNRHFTLEKFGPDAVTIVSQMQELGRMLQTASPVDREKLLRQLGEQSYKN